MIISLYYFLMYEIKAFPNAYFDVARDISGGIETDSSVMKFFSIVFAFSMMFGGIAFFIAAAIIVLPLVLTFAIVTIAAEYIQESVFPKQSFVIDIIAIPILLIITYYFGHTYLNFIFIPAFKFGLGIVLSILSIPSKYGGEF